MVLLYIGKNKGDIMENRLELIIDLLNKQIEEEEYLEELEIEELEEELNEFMGDL